MSGDEQTAPDEPGLTTENGDPLPYGEALTELEAILTELESSSVDVDRLAERVHRASILVRHCRARLDVVRDDVAGVVADLGRSETIDD